MIEDMKSYCGDLGITSADVITTVKSVCPKYSRITHSMAANPAYGLTLREEAEKALTQKYGAPSKPPRIAHKDTHSLTCRISARMSAERRSALNSAMQRRGINTDQQLLTKLIDDWLLDQDIMAWGRVTRSEAQSAKTQRRR